MSEPIVQVTHLQKTYKVPVRESGVRAAIRSLIRREHREVRAVEDISFDVGAGEIVGFLGPNGAGKTTTLKMLAGLLHPSGGVASVLGYEPHKRDHDFLRRITLVMGQRNQLIWDIPVIDSFERNRAIYRLEHSDYRKTLGDLTELLDLSNLLNKPVRNLSLGERMKCEIAASLLHIPSVLFLDEPTIGLDVGMQRRIRQFIKDHNEKTGASVLLTSHYMADVEALCKRVIVIHHGKLLFDGDLSGLVQRFSAYKTISVDLDEQSDIDFSTYGEVLEQSSVRAVIRVMKTETPAITARMLSELRVQDLTVEDPPIEEIIERVFDTRSDAP